MLCYVGEKHAIKDRQSLMIENLYYFSIGCCVLYDLYSIAAFSFLLGFFYFKNELVTLVLNERIFTYIRNFNVYRYFF